MRLYSITRFSLLALLVSSLFSCNEKEEFVTDKISEYMPMTVGKYIVYRLDSLVFTEFGRTIETRRYQQKDEVAGTFTDLAGRPSFRIQRYLRDSLGIGSWQPLSTYVITALADQVEVLEDNLRFIKLHMPVTDGFSWKGNKFMPDNPYQLKYNFSNDNEMELWDYYYDGLAAPFSYRGINYTDVLSVEEIDEAFNVPITSPTSYAARSRAVAKYSKSIGLVYQEYELWEYQPNTGGAGGPYYTGFGVKRWMIDHN